jgi:deazaflavin-dependent oxidoreductase (nitroreductase family)
MPAMKIYQNSMRRLARMNWFRWVLSKAATPLDIRLKNTRFAPSKMGVDFPLCYLTTTGRTSGEQRTVPLFFVRIDGVPAVVATNWGTANHPGWSYNLEAHPSASLEIDGQSSEVVARPVSPTEAISAWDQFIAVWPAYAEYRERASREIKVYALSPE